MQLVRGYSPLQAGASPCRWPSGLLALRAVQKMVERFGARKVIGFGLVLAGSVFASFVFLQPDTHRPGSLLVTWFFLGFGLGNVIAPATTRMTLAVPRRRLEQARRCRTPVRQVAAALGVAVLSSVVAIAYTNTIRDAPGITELPQAP